jgi:hypothetical protein
MFDADGVKRASEHFIENRNKYPFDMRRSVASKIVEKTAEYCGKDVKVPDCIRKEAGIGLPRRDTLMAELLERAQIVKDAELSVELCKMAEMVAEKPMTELEPALTKIALTIEDIDRAEGLHTMYGRRLLCPADFVYDIDIKEAMAVSEDTVELDRYMFSLTKLAELDPSVYGECLGEDFASRITADGKVDSVKLADELFSLPKPDKVALERHLETAFGQ